MSIKDKKLKELRKAIEIGLQSGFDDNFDRKKHIRMLMKKAKLKLQK